MSVSAKRNARIELVAGTTGMDRGLADARRKVRTFEREQARSAKQAERDATRRAKSEQKARAKSMQSIRGGVAQGFGQAIGLDAISGLQQAGQDVLDYERSLTRLQITASKSPETMRAFSDQVMAASNATGLNRKDVLDAASAYVALTGDMETAQKSTSTWAKIAQATGTPIADIASTAAAMSQQMGITSADMESVFSGLAAQGKAGAVELKDLAGLMAQIAPQWAMFKDGKGAKGVAELGAALQIVKRGFGGDAAETVTGLQSMLTALVKNAGRFEDGGIKIFDVGKDGKKTMRDVFSIVESISKSKLVKDPEAMEKAFGRVEAYRAYVQLSQNRDALEGITKAAGDAGVVQRDFDTYMGSASGRMEQSWARVKNAIAEALTPERIEAFADAVSSLADKIEPVAKLVGAIGDVLGGISGVGKSIRGSFSGADGRRPAAERAVDHAIANGDVSTLRHLTGQTTPITAEQSTAAKGRIESDKGRGRAMDSILGGEKDEKTTPESIRRAVVAGRLSTNEGERTMGNRYLANVYDSGDKVSEAVDRVVREMGSGIAKQAATDARQIAEAVASAISGLGIKIGGEPIQKASANSISHRQGKH